MGAFTGACLLAMAGAFLATMVYGGFEGAAAMGGGSLGAVTGVVLGFALALWLVLHNGGLWAGKSIAALTGAAIMMMICLAFVAFS